MNEENMANTGEGPQDNRILPRPQVHVASATFSDDCEVSFGDNDIVLIVGPNNSGKSEALRGIWDLLREEHRLGRVVTKLSIGTNCTPEAALEWFRSHADYVSKEKDPAVAGPWGNATESFLLSVMRGGTLQGLFGYFAVFLTTVERIESANAVGPFNHDVRHHGLPLHLLFKDEELEKRVSKPFEGAFGVRLIVHRQAGGSVPLLVGAPPALMEGEKAWSTSYVKRLEMLPGIEAQGDGMRCFAGIVLRVLASDYGIVLIDEPEAFLHPPQVRVLARTICTPRKCSQQLFLATHSGDFVRAALEAGGERVRVVRLQRGRGVNHVSELANDDLMKLWSDPLLRYSQIFDALFHEGAVICESDSDCRFYAAVAEACGSAGSHDLQFTPCGGKDRLAVVARALRAIDVPVAMIADFDILNEESTIRKTVESLGGVWDDLKKDWTTVYKDIEGRRPDLNAKAVKEEIDRVFSKVQTEALEEAERLEIREALRRSSPWEQVKSQGKSAVHSGDPSRALERLLTELEKLRLFVVPVGELERFEPLTGTHGPKWVSSVLEQYSLADAKELAGARDFVSRVVKSLLPTGNTNQA